MSQRSLRSTDNRRKEMHNTQPSTAGRGNRQTNVGRPHRGRAPPRRDDIHPSRVHTLGENTDEEDDSGSPDERNSMEASKSASFPGQVKSTVPTSTFQLYAQRKGPNLSDDSDDSDDEANQKQQKQQQIEREKQEQLEKQRKLQQLEQERQNQLELQRKEKQKQQQLEQQRRQQQLEQEKEKQQQLERERLKQQQLEQERLKQQQLEEERQKQQQLEEEKQRQQKLEEEKQKLEQKRLEQLRKEQHIEQLKKEQQVEQQRMKQEQLRLQREKIFQIEQMRKQKEQQHQIDLQRKQQEKQHQMEQQRKQKEQQHQMEQLRKQQDKQHQMEQQRKQREQQMEQQRKQKEQQQQHQQLQLVQQHYQLQIPSPKGRVPSKNDVMRKRKNDSSAERAGNKKSMTRSPSVSPPRTSAVSRPSRRRRREELSKAIISSSDSSSSSEKESDDSEESRGSLPPRRGKNIQNTKQGSTRRNRNRESESGSQRREVHRQEEVEKETTSHASRKRRVPKTPSPSQSVERSVSPPPPPHHIDRQLMSPSPFAALVPPPTPSVPRETSPMPSSSRQMIQAPATPQPKVARYDARSSEKVKAIGGVDNNKASSDLAASWKSTDSISVPHIEYVCTPGTIKSVTMVNIMSHKQFEKQWSPTFNFIIGENGSGKSAILSGIVAGLGGKAFDTGRATSMRDIIRNGQTKAKIEIVLNNYPSKLYGDDIKIVRTLSREGSSRYQIRDSNKVLRSLGRQELNLVLSKLNIQVDNPLAILHQEMSRNFLRTKDPSLLYGYFYRALLLSSCETLIKKSSADLLNAVTCLKAKKSLLEDLRTKELELKKQVEVIEALRKCKTTLQRYENEHAWALVSEYEIVVKAAKKEFDVATRRLEESIKEKTACADKARQLENNQASFEQVWQGVSDALVTKTREYEKKRAEAHNVRMRLTEVQSKLRITREQVGSLGQNLQTLQLRVDRHRHDLENTYERHMRELEAKKLEYNEQLLVITNQIQLLRAEEEELVKTEEQAVRIEEHHGYQLHDIKRKIEEKKQEIRDFERAKNSKYDAYGREMTKLMNHINKANFIKKPRGPLGCCYTVKDEKWAPLVEFIMEGSLCSFAVDNQHDRAILHRLIDDAYKETGRGRNFRNVKRPSLCLLPFGDRKIDVAKGKAYTPGHPTILDVIDIVDDDYVVFNWLIDSNRVERILLFESYAEACDLMKDRRKIPKTTIRGYSLDAYMFYPDPNFKALVQHKLKPARFLAVTQHGGQSSISTVEHLQMELGGVQEEYNEIFRNYSAYQTQTHHARNLVQTKSMEIKGWCSRQNQLKSELRTLETSVCNAPDIATWMEEIERTKQRIHDKEKEIETLQSEFTEFNAKLNIKELKAVEEQINGLQSQQNNLLEQKNSAELKIGELHRDLRKKEAMCNNLHKIKVEATKKYKETEKTLKHKTTEARKKCARVTELIGTSKEIKTKWETLNAELLKNQKKIGQRELIIRQYLNAKDVADKVKDEIQIMALLIRLAQPRIKLQQDHFRRKMLEYGISVGTCFRNLIKSRGYWGDLAISHDEKTLMCFVSLDTTSEARAMRNLECVNGQQVVTSKKGIMEYASGMSGGERSFTTICFLIACWQLMDMPFYILDEFDVFMDQFNRRISQYILMNVAKSKPYAQFFIFTPLAVEAETPKGAIILKLFKHGKETDERAEDEKEEENDKRKLRAGI